MSATESIDGTPSGRLTHGILASIAEYYSLNLSAEVKKGLHGKARLGGTPGYVKIGYLNAGKVVDGREVRTVEIDPDRGPHITWAFTAELHQEEPEENWRRARAGETLQEIEPLQ